MKHMSVVLVIIVFAISVKLNRGSASTAVTRQDFYDAGPDNSMVYFDDEFDSLCFDSRSDALPGSISNLKTFPSFTFTNFQATCTNFLLLGVSVLDLFEIYVWSQVSGGFSEGDTIQTIISVDDELLQRAHNDISSAYNVDPDEIYPDYLMIAQYNDVRFFMSTAEGQGTTVQSVLATNGRYTYLIIQFAAVEIGTLDASVEAFFKITEDSTQRENNFFPYSSNPSEAANNMFKSNKPGKYIIDLNDIPPPPPCPTCSQRIESVVCDVLKRKAELDGTATPRPCQDN